MKINKVFKNFGLAFAAIAAMAPAPTVTVKAANNTQQTQKANKDQTSNVAKSARQFIREDAGGFQVVSHFNGIPPHIYGAYHVRRATHKRTNKG
jgi:hypothetical protein